MRSVFFLTLGTALAWAVPVHALSYVKVYPTHNGMHVAGCPTADTTRCIQTNGPLRAATLWCRAHGMDRATNYKTDSVRARGGAWHIETSSACRHPNCIMFMEITCAAAAARPSAPAQPAPAYQPVRVNRPHMNGIAVDWCLTRGANCGARAAYAVCQRLGYRGALNWATYHAGQTYVMGSNAYCRGANCQGFSYIVCAR